MHKRFFGPLMGVLAAALLFSANAGAFDEGIDYKTLSQPQATETGDKIEVLELFWYGCPHCYHLEPKLKSWLEAKPDYVEFRRMPVVMGSGWVNHGRAFFAAEMMGVLEQVHEPFFKALHDEKRRLSDEKSIADWMAKQGVDRDEFLKAYRSFVVDMKVRRATQFGQRLGLEGVPAFVVNGKYTTSPTQTASVERALQVVAYLAAIEAGKTPKPAEEEQPAVAAAEPTASPAPQAPAEAEQAAGESRTTREAGLEAAVPEGALAQSEADPAAGTAKAPLPQLAE